VVVVVVVASGNSYCCCCKFLVVVAAADVVVVADSAQLSSRPAAGYSACPHCDWSQWSRHVASGQRSP